MISLKDLSIGFSQKLLLKNVTTSFLSDGLTALIGRNGSGKSTLLKTICGLNPINEGEIMIDNISLKEISRYKLASLLSFVNSTRPRMSNLRCIDIVALGRSPHTAWHGKLTQEDKDFSVKALEMVGMKDYASRDFNSLSDGESQKIMIARAIAQDTPIILLDEPTSFLDLPTRFEIVALLKQLSKESSKTIIFSTHELDIALEMSDNIALINRKELINKPVQEILKGGYLEKIFDTPNRYLSRYLNFLLTS